MAKDQQGKTHAKQDITNQNQQPVPPMHMMIIDPFRTVGHWKAETTDDKKDSVENLLPWFLKPEWIIVYVTLSYVVITGFTLRAIWRQAKIAEMTARSLMDADRAWLLVTVGKLPDITPVPDLLQILWIEPRVDNAGRTPAWTVRMRLRAQQFPSLKDIPPEPIYEGEETKHFDGEAALPPGASVAPLRVGVDAHDFTAIRQGKSFLYVYGFIDYMDIYKRSFSTRFCFLYHVPGGFNPIPEGFVFGGPSAYNKVT